MTSKQKLQQNTPKAWQIPPLREGDHKYSRGHVLLLGGEIMTGAAQLAARAAQRTGAGVVTLAADEKAWPIYAASMMSIITRPITGLADWKWILTHRKVSAVLLGPGAEADGLLAKALLAAHKSGLPLIVDATALTLMADQPGLRKKLAKANAAYLPHEGEFKKLSAAMKLKPTKDRGANARLLAKALGGVVALKGAETFIAHPDGRLRRHYVKAPWLATAGAGDVLAGIAAALAGQGMNLFDATSAAVWLHGQAARGYGRGMIAEDLIAALPKVLRDI